MAVSLPPLPNSPLTDTFIWREWLYQVSQTLTQQATIAWTSLNFTGSNITDIQTRVSGIETMLGKTNASYTFNSYKIMPITNAQVIVLTEPTDARANGLYSYNTIINETPNTSNNIVNTNNFSGDLMVVLGRDDVSKETGITIDLSGN